MRRRTNAEIREVHEIHDRTDSVAREITARVNPDENDPNYINVSARSYWHVKPEYQKDAAVEFVVSFSTKDPVLIERVARAIKASVAERSRWPNG